MTSSDYTTFHFLRFTQENYLSGAFE